VKESNLSKEISVALSAEGRGKIVSWRNNVGSGIAISAKGPRFTALLKAIVQLAAKMGCSASPITYGLCTGSSDRIGITTVTVTPAMVGREMGVFTAWEIKTSIGRVSEDQTRFIAAVRKAGGFAGVVRSSDEALAVCNPLDI
jgi:VRR-NUC domain